MADTTWHPLFGSNDYTNGGNWSNTNIGSPGDDDTGIFGTSNVTDLMTNTVNQPGGWLFNPGAAHYTFDITSSGGIQFFGTGIIINGGGASINDGGIMDFYNNSTAGKAVIAVVGGGLGTGLNFHDGSNAGEAIITNGNQLSFNDDSSAASATIITLAGAHTTFADNSSAGNARLSTVAGGTVDFSKSSGLAGDHVLTVGSIAGGGTYDLGGDRLVVGSNNLATVVSGAIEDGGSGGGSGASLVKVGNRVLTLSGAGNTYSGGTTLRHGTLALAAVGAAGTGAITFAGPAELRIANAALSPGHLFANAIDAFGNQDFLDLSGLHFSAGAAATYHRASHHLTVHSGSVTDTLTLLAPHGTHFTAVGDGHGGTEVMLIHA